jgi:hypothetical protein
MKQFKPLTPLEQEMMNRETGGVLPPELNTNLTRSADLRSTARGTRPGTAPGLARSIPRNAQLFTQRAFTVGTSSLELLLVRPNRTYLLIQNKNSISSMYINFAGQADTVNGIEIPAGGVYESYRVPINAIYVIGAAVSLAGVVVEGYNPAGIVGG